jgi:hypothetical protein
MTSWTPLGNFSPTASLDAGALAAGKLLLSRLPECPVGGITRIYLHWSVGHYAEDFPDYNVSVAFNAGHFTLDITGNPQDNVAGFNNNPEHSHTFMRNTGAVGIATDDMYDGNEHDFGPEPLTLQTLEYLCAAAAAVATRYGVDANGQSSGSPYGGEPTILTHAEAANLVGSPVQYSAYGPKPLGDVERWDLSTFQPTPEGVDVSVTTATQCGNAMRQRAHAYKLAMV